MKNFQYALRNFPFHLNNLLVLFLLTLWLTFAQQQTKNGSMTWSMTQDKISILYYFNDENINLENILSFLSTFARTYGLDSEGWKLPFTMPVSNSEHRNYDYFKRIEFICKKLFFYFFSFLLINNAKLQRDFCLLQQCTSLLLFF